MAENTLEPNEMALNVVNMLRPELYRVMDLGLGLSSNTSCCEGKCPCNENCGGHCGCNAKCSCEAKEAIGRECTAENIMSGLLNHDRVITPEDWARIHKNLTELNDIRTRAMNTK